MRSFLPFIRTKTPKIIPKRIGLHIKRNFKRGPLKIASTWQEAIV
jgi:hypothetical protein